MGRDLRWVRAASCLVALSAACASGTAAQAGPRPQLFTGDRSHALAIGSATRLLEAHRLTTGVPGMQVAVGVKGRLVWSAGLGHADVASGRLVTADTRFRIGSTSKALTATLVALLAEDGPIDLGAPVQTWVPSFPTSVPPITLRHLVGHTSGIRHYDGPDELHRSERYETMIDALEIFAADPLRFPPGSAMYYSSYGYNLLGAVVEVATGQAFLEALRTHLTDPAGMEHTGGDGEVSGPSATPYVGSRDDRRPSPIESFSYKWPSGGLVSTADDLVRFGIGLLDGSIMSRQRAEALWSSLRTSDDLETGYGFGWNLLEDRAGRRVVAHGGNLDSGRAHLLIYPELELVVAILANTGESIFFNEGEALEIGDLFARDVEPGGAVVSPPPAATHGRWSFEAQSPFEPSGTVRGSMVIQRPQGPFAGEIVLDLDGVERTLALGLAEAVEGRIRLITVGGTHLELLLDVEGDAFTGEIRAAWVPPPTGILRAAPREIRERLEERGRPRAISGRRMR